MPIERLFGALKQKDFERDHIPAALIEALPAARRFTHVQTIMSKVASYMFSIQKDAILSFFSVGVRNLDAFLDEKII